MTGWIRFYRSILETPKLWELPAETYRFWSGLLLICEKKSGKLPGTNEIAFHLHTTPKAVVKMLRRLSAGNLVDACIDGSYALHDWAQWQYESDTSASRMKRLRTAPKLPKCDGVVTVPDDRRQNTETETNDDGRETQSWKQTAEAVRFHFPAADDEFINRLIDLCPSGRSDAEVAAAVYAAKTKKQYSQGLFLTTVPGVLRRTAPKKPSKQEYQTVYDPKSKAFIQERILPIGVAK